MLLGDSAYPLTAYPTAWGGQPVVGWAFYIGGDTPHVWSDEEIAALPYRYRLPIYTRSDPAGRSGLEDAQGPIAWLRAHRAPAGSLIQLDYETAVNSRYEQDFDAAVRAAGYRMELYGSATTVVNNAVPSGGYDEAAWTGSDYAPASTADQFADVGTFDLNDFRPTAPLWDTRPQPAPQPAAPAANIEEDDMAQAQNGYVTLSWSTGSKHVVQVAFDAIGGNQPDLRAVLLLESGPLVLAESWKPTAAARVIEFPDHAPTAYGLELQPVGTPARYAAVVA